MANEEENPTFESLLEGGKGEPAEPGSKGPGAVYGPGGYYDKTQEAMYGGVKTAYDTAVAASAAPGKVLAGAEKQAGVLRQAHTNALVAARQAMAQKAMQATRRGRTTAGNIQAAGTLGKEAAQTYSTMASQQAAEIASVEQAAAKEAAGLEVLAAQAWEEANIAAQSYWTGLATLSETADAKFQTDLNAALTSITNAASGDVEGTLGGFDAAWNQAEVYMSSLDPKVSQHVVAAEQIIMETLNQAPISVPTPVVKSLIPQLFDAFGLQGALDVLAALVWRWNDGINGEFYVPNTSRPPLEDGTFPLMLQTATLPHGDADAWQAAIKYMVENGVGVNELPPFTKDSSGNWVIQ